MAKDEPTQESSNNQTGSTSAATPLVPGVRKQWFCFGGDVIEYFDSEDEARGAAVKALEFYRDCCDPEWPEEVGSICWGKVHQVCREQVIEQPEFVPSGVDYVCDFNLVDAG